MTADGLWVLQTAKESGGLRVLICDDEPGSLERIRKRAAEVFHKLAVEVELDLASSSAELSEEQLKSCDIALLDIDFQDSAYSGIDIARALRRVNRRALIMFVTNFIEYAPEGYEVQAFRYILKRDMEEVLGRYLMQALEQLSEMKKVLRLQSRGEPVQIPLSGILYLEVLQHSVSVLVREGEEVRTYTVNATLSSFEQQLERHGFLRIHKSYLVNMAHIRRFRSRECLLDDGTMLMVSEKNYAQQKRRYLLWKGLR